VLHDLSNDRRSAVSLLRVMTTQLDAMSRLFDAQLQHVRLRSAAPREPQDQSACPLNESGANFHPGKSQAFVIAKQGPEPFPLASFEASVKQRELLALLEAHPQAARAYQETVALEIRGGFELDTLRRAWHLVEARHAGLRLRVSRSGDFTLAATTEGLALRTLAAPVGIDGATAAVEDSLSRPLGLHDAALTRTEFFHLGADLGVLILTAHHLVADGWSMGLLLSEWAEVYNALRRGSVVALAGPAQWEDFCKWSSGLEHAAAAPPLADERNAPAPLLLPQSTALEGFGGCRVHWRDPTVMSASEQAGSVGQQGQAKRETKGLMQVARRCARLIQVSPSTVLLGVYAVFLARLCSQTRLGIGMPVAGHGLAGLPNLVAMASAVMPLDIDLQAAKTFRQAVQIVDAELTRSRQNAHRLFAPDHADGFPVSALFNIDPGVQLSFDGATLEPQRLPLRHVKTGLFFNLLEFNDTVLLDFDCHEGIGDAARAERLLHGMVHLAGHALQCPDAPLATLSMGRLEAQPKDPSLRLVDWFGGAAAQLVPARLSKVDAHGAVTDTGLMARADEAGAVEILGEQGRFVRSRHGWVDLAAIDTALMACDGVADAATVVQGDELTAFVLPCSSATPDLLAIHRALRQRMAQPLLPHEYVIATGPIRDDAGAVDWDRLRSADWPRIKAQARVAARDALEGRIAAIWQDVLRLTDAPGMTDDFFACGGHSLKAVVLSNRVAQSEGCLVRLADFFRAPTIAQLAELIRTAGRMQPIAVVPAAERVRLSHAQRRMWLLEQMEVDRSAYNMGFLLRRDKPLLESAARRALQTLTHRHESLRSAFIHSMGELALRVTDAVAPALKVHDLRGGTGSSAALDALALQFVNAKFDMARPPLWGAALVHTDMGDSLVVSMHHSIGDNWSITVWLRDFLALLEAAEQDSHDPVALPALSIQYPDFAAWHNQRTDNATASLEFWGRTLAQSPSKLLLPTCRPRTPESVADVSGHAIVRRVSASLQAEFRRLCRERGVSGFMLLTATWRLWLWGSTGARDAVLGTVHAGRDHPALADQIGLYVNTLPLRIRVDPEASFVSLLDHVQQQAVAAFEHAEVPFNRIVEHLQLPREGDGNPLFEVLVTHDDMQEFDSSLRAAGWTVKEVELPVSPFEMILTGSEDADGMELRLQYRTALWDENRTALWLEELEGLLERICRAPHQRLASLVLPEDLVLPDAQQGVVEHFEKWRRLNPHAPAVLGAPVRSYHDIGVAADALCARLMLDGVAPNEVVAVLVDRSWDLPVSVIGIMKARTAFVLLDPTHPLERLAYIVADAGCRRLVHSEALAGLAQGLCTTAPLASRSSEVQAATLRMLTVHDAAFVFAGRDKSPEAASACKRDDLAYLIYTSGSTGEPKGVLVDHGALSDHLEGVTPVCLWTSSDRSLLFATVAVDAVIEQLLLPLVNGAAFCILDAERFSPQAYVESWRRWQATILDVPPVFWGELINWCARHPEAVAGLSIKRLMTGGEEMTPQRVAGWYALPVFCGQTLNLFGPTETVCSPVIARVAPHHATLARIPVGFPVGPRRLRVVGPDGQDAALGDEGELWLGGSSVARGYLNQPALTAERFITDGQSVRWYRTGDLVRQGADGELEFLGRIDRQFKLRGFRIEPAEIEDALRRCEGVQDAVVTLEAQEDGAELQAWLVPKPGVSLTRFSILQQLAAGLPAHMLPKRLRRISHLPLSRTEKLDRKALGLMAGEDLWDVDADDQSPAEMGPMDAFCQLIAKVIGIPRALASDNFFAVGGHSLKAIEVVARVREKFAVEIRVRDVFTAGTLLDLYNTVRAAVRASGQRIKAVARDQPLPASAGQKRLWLLQSLTPESVAFNMVAAFLIKGPINAIALQAACAGVVARHEVLRSRLMMRGGQLAQIITPASQAPLLSIEQGPTGFIGDGDAPMAQALEATLHEELNRPFQLEAEAPIRMRLLTSSGVSGFVVNVHHAAFDGWSATVLLSDLTALYRTACRGPAGREQAVCGVAHDGCLQPLAMQYADYAFWQDSLIPASHREYWLSRFDAESLPVLHLPTDKPRPPVASGRGALVPRSFNKDCAQALKDLAVREGVTLFGVMLALTAAQLHARSGQTDFVVGTAVAGRDSPELEQQIGFYVNMLPLRCRVRPEQSFRYWVRELGEVARQAVLHQEYPFDALVQELDPKRPAGRQPLFDVVLNLQNFKPLELVLEGTITRLLQDRSVSAKYDLMYMVDDVASLDLYLEYATDLFEPAAAQALADEFISMGAALCREPDRQVGELLQPWLQTAAAMAAPNEPITVRDDQW